MSNQVTELTRQYWIDTILGWAEDRLAPPQYDECCIALAQAPAAAIQAAEQAAMAEQLERDMHVMCRWCRSDEYEPAVWEQDGKYWHYPKRKGEFIQHCGAGAILDDDENADWHDHYAGVPAARPGAQ